MALVLAQRRRLYHRLTRYEQQQDPDYKATKKALLNFITELARVSKATNPHLANPKAWLF
jgi:ribosomal protein S18